MKITDYEFQRKPFVKLKIDKGSFKKVFKGSIELSELLRIKKKFRNGNQRRSTIFESNEN